jgi:release factor glutamine methyltransferase
VTAEPPDVLAAAAARLRAAGCVFAEEEAQLLADAASTRADLEAMVERRASGLPLEHVVGWAEFCGLRITVGPGVFVPRRRSELLVRRAIAAARESRPAPGSGPLSESGPPSESARAPRPVILDLCCGSGAIGVAVVAALGAAELHAVDVEPAAVACARENVAAIGGHVYQGDLYDPLPAALRGRVDVLAVNAPYVPTGEIALMPPEARLHEPAVALDGGTDGVAIHRRIAAEAARWLAPTGRLLIETSDRQAALTAAAMTAGGLLVTVTSDDDLAATVVAGSLPESPLSDSTARA